MKSTIRNMEQRDRQAVAEMMRVFYASEAVFKTAQRRSSARILTIASMRILFWKALSWKGIRAYKAML